MNYSGWVLSPDLDGHQARFAFGEFDAAGSIVVPDAHLLFSGEYRRAGGDLIISDHLRNFVVSDYFKGGGNGRPLLVSPDGAPLAPSVVDALTGYTVYAQADPQGAAGKVVGHVVKMTGSASIVRNGVTIVANVGDAIYQNDVVQTGSNSTLGLVLDDGSTFNLSANARFLLNDLSYDPNSTSNSLFLTLVQGAASFVAGQVAKTGDMRVATPVASIGIRGTAVNLDISSTDGKVSISVVDQQDGAVHAVQVFNNAGVLIGTVTSNGTSLTLTPTATFDVIAQQVNKTPDQVAQEFNAFQQVLSTYDAAKQIFPNLPQHTDNSDHQDNNPNPNSTTKFAGSPPLNPPGTEYHSPAATTSVQTASNEPTKTVVLSTTTTVDPSVTKQGLPVIDPLTFPVPVTVPVQVISLPFVVARPNVVDITTGPGDHSGPVMSANGDVVYDPDGAIYFYDRAADTTTTIASPANGWSYGSPTISSDGRYIFYQGSNGGSSYVFVYGTDASDPTHYHVQTLLAPGQAPAVSGDGGTVVVEQAPGNIGIYNLQGHLKETITPAIVGSSGALWLPAISADGHIIAFWNSDAPTAGGSGSLYAFNLATAKVVHIADTLGGGGTIAPTVSADGQLIAYQTTDASGHSEIHLYDLGINSIVFETANSSGSSYRPTLSPDGHFIVFTSDAQLTSDDTNAAPDVYVVDVTSPSHPTYKLVSDSGVTTSGGVAISAGGQYVAYGTNSNIFFADPTSGHSAVIVETANSPSILTADGLIPLTGDYSGVQISVADQFGKPAPNFSASFDSSGHIQWTFSESRSDFAALQYGKDATQEFVVTLSADTGTLTIPVFVTVHNSIQPTISVADFAPVTSPVNLPDGQENVPYTITSTELLSHVVDVDGPALSIVSLSLQSGDGTLSQVDSQTWIFTPTAGSSGHVILDYQVTDSIKSSLSTASFNIPLPLAITSINPDSGVTGDFITRDTNLTASGTNGALVGGEKIQISSDNGVTWTDVVQTSPTAWDFSDPATHNTSFTYQVRVVDSSNVTINSTAQAVAIDTAPPTVSISTSGTTTNQATQTISGTVAAAAGEAPVGSTVTLFDTVNGVTTQVGTATVGSGGAWSTSVTLAGNGSNSIVAQDTDVAGNTGSSTAVIFNAVAGRWGNPSGGSWTAAANWSIGTLPGPSSNVVFEPVGATAPYVVTIPAFATITVNTITLDDPNVTLLDQANLTITGSLVESAGAFEISNGGSLSVGGGASLLIDFAGSGGSLVLGSSPGFSGTIDAISAATGAVTISGSGNVTTTAGDAIDLQGSSGTPASPSSLKVSVTGTITGAANGIVVVQNAVGDIEVDSAGSVVGGAGNGILAEIGATESGNITVTATGSVSGSGAGMNGVLAENLDASNNGNVTVTATGGASGNEYGIEALTYGNGNVSVEAGGTVTSSKQYGIRALSYGSGNVSVVTDPGSTINSAGSGINAINKDTVIAGSVGTSVSVTANGTINFGSTLNLSGAAPSGIVAGFYGANGTTNGAINGTVLVTNSANITQTSGATGYGIDAFNDGNGNVTVNDGAGTKISTMQNGIVASLSGGTGDVAVNVGTNATIAGKSGFGIDAHTSSVGHVGVTMADGDIITSKSDGIKAYNQATAIPFADGSTITVSARGTIDSGPILHSSGSQPAGILAGYEGGVNSTPNANVFGSVIIDNFANVIAGGGDGIRGYNYGVGNITITDEADKTIIAPGEYGIRETNYGSGNELVTTSSNDLIVSGSSGINLTNFATAIASSADSTVSVVAHGTIYSGTVLNGSGSQPQGIVAGYYGSNGTPNNSINGTVSIDNYANIVAAAGYAVQAYNQGNGPVTVTEESGTSVVGAQYGIGAYSLGTSGPATATTSGATSTSSQILNFVSVPSWIVAGMTVYDVTTGKSIGTVASTTGTTVTLMANASNAVANGDLLSFPPAAITNGATSISSATINFASTPSWVAAGMTVYDVTTGKSIGTVAATTGSAVTLTANAANAVGSGDILSFGDVNINVLSNATIAAGALYGSAGITASTNNAANIMVTTSAGDIINSGGRGISLNSAATSASAASQILTTAYGTINSGFNMNTGGGTPGGIWAGYNGGTGTFHPGVAGNVTIDDFATIHAAAGAGIGSYNFGVGNISVTAEAASSITAPYQGVSAFALGGGDVTVVNKGIITSLTGTGIAVGTGSSLSSTGSGILSITNIGTKDPSGNFTSGIIQALGASFNAGATTAVVQINNGSTQASTFTNSGLVRSTLYSVGSPMNWAVSSYYGGNAANNGAVTITNSGVIFGDVSLNVAPTGTSSFQNLAGGVWNILGGNFFNGAGSITNFGTINIAGPSQINGSALSIANSGVVDLASTAVAFIAGNVSGTGSFNIGAQASLEFGGTVGVGQTVLPTVYFGGEQGLLILDNPSSFNASIVGAVAGDIIQAGPGYTPPSGFSSLSGNLWLMLPTSAPTVLTGSLGPQSLNPATAGFVQLSSATISSGAANGLNVFTADSNPADTLFVEIDQPSSVAVTGAFTGVNLTTAGANIAVFNAGSITSTGGTGLSTTTGAGATTIDDFANISGFTGIRAVGGGTAFTSAATATTSNTLNFASTPSWIVPGLAVYDETTGKSIGVVQSTTSATVLLSANAANAVGNGDTLSFGAPTAITNGATPIQGNVLSLIATPSWIVPGTAVYDETTGAIIGTVSSTSATTATLMANAANPVGNGDTLAFAGPISINVGESAIISGPTATGATATTASNTLNLASALSWVAAGMTVYDVTTDQVVGTVSSPPGAGTTVTLTANAASAVGSTDLLSFLASGTQGIVAQSSSGSVNVNTGSFVDIIAGGNGINVQNRGKLVAPSALTVDAAGKISSGLVSGGGPAAIQVGYVGGTSSPSSIPNPPLSGIFGDITIDSAATIAAYSGSGINAFTYGTGNISVSNSGSITATAASNTNGTANPSTGLYNPTTAQVGINLVNYGDGDVTLVTTGAITSGSAGIYASNAAKGSQTTPVGSPASPIKVMVVANGPINSGPYLPNGGNAPGGILANFDPGNITGYDGYVYGDLLVSASGSSINAQAGDGIRAFNHAQGNITVDIGANETITALNTATGASGNLAPIGIALNAYGPGDVTVSTSIGDVITSGSTGINANQQATAIAAAANAIVAINAAGTIISGNIQNDSGGAPAAINAGFYNSGTALPNVNGSVIINNSATVIAAARGLSGYNYGNGDVTVNNNANVTVTGDNVRANSTTTTTRQVTEYGIQAATWGEGKGDVAVNLYSGAISATATPTGTAAAATSTSSTTLSFGSTPSGIAAGMTAYDVTTGRALGTVSSTTATTVTLASNAVAAVANGDMLSFFSAITGSTAAATSTSSATLSFGSTPAGIAAGMVAYDLTNGAAIGTVSSTTATTITLSANAPAAIASGDTLSFSTPITNQVSAVFAENNDSGNISVITSPGTSIYSSGVGINATNEGSPVAVATQTASAATATTSNTLTFAAAPTWITLGNPVYDVTTHNVIGTVSSTTATTVTLTASAANAVSQGDKLSFAQLAVTNSSTSTSSNTLTFGSTPAWIATGMTVYDITTGKTVGTVSSTRGNTVTLAANAANPVSSGDALSFPEIATATAATSTSSQTLSFAVTPSWIATGMTVYDDTTGTAIGTVSSTTGTTVSLAANASSAVASGDVLSFASSSIVVTSNSTITSGDVRTGTGAPPAGITAAYLGGDAIPAVNPVIGVNGSVTVNNFGDITAATGDGIRALTYGIGDVTVNDGAGKITALGGPNPTNGFGDGIDARAWGPGDILVTTASGITINSGSSGISAINYSPSTGNSLAVPSSSQITVIAHGTINSGVIPTLSGGAPAGILAGYNPGVSSTNPVDAVNPLVAGNVLVQDYASITAAAGTDGIRAFNYGTGSVSVIIESGATIVGAQYGVAGSAYDGGNVSITNYASISGTTAAIDAEATGAGTILIENHGTITDAVVSSSSAITLDNEFGGTWAFTGKSSVTGPTTLINNGSIAINGTALMVDSLSGSGAVSVGNNGSLEVGTAGGGAAGSIIIDSGATATLAGTFGSTTFVDNGTIVLTGAASLTGILSGTGQIDIGVGASLAIASVAATAPSIAFQGSGTLALSSADLDGTLTFSPIITGLDITDKINFAGSVTSAFWHAGILTLENGTTPVAYLHLSGNYDNSTFTVTQANGVSQIIDPPAAGNVITNGASLELSAPSSDKISFAGTGTLVLDQPAGYEGQIAGFSGSDVLTLKGFDAAHTTANAIYNQQNDTTVLTISDTSDHHAASLILDGSCSSTAFNVTAHENGGVDVTSSPETVPVGGELELNRASSDTITFRGGTGVLVIDQPQSFTGAIAKFTGTAPDAVHSDVIDVRNINYDSSDFDETYHASTGVLSLTDGLHSATIKFEEFLGTLNFASDKHGGTLITDPPATRLPQGDAAAIANNDQFVFKTVLESQATPEHFGRGESIGLEHHDLDPSDSASFGVWLSDHATSSLKDSLINSTLDREHLDTDMMLLKKAALVSLHPNDFVLPMAG